MESTGNCFKSKIQTFREGSSDHLQPVDLIKLHLILSTFVVSVKKPYNSRLNGLIPN